NAFTTANAATTTPPGNRTLAVPTPPFRVLCASVAPAPAPTHPVRTGPSLAADAARYPHSASGRFAGSPPLPRSKTTAAGTIGTTTPDRTSTPRPCSSHQHCTPDAAANPYALPPVSVTASTV